MENVIANSPSSKWKQILLSMLVPGLGHFFIREKRKGKVYLIIGFIVLCASLIIQVHDSVVWLFVTIAPSVIVRGLAIIGIYRHKGLECQNQSPSKGFLFYFTSIVITIGITVLGIMFPLFHIGWYQIPTTGNFPTVEKGDMGFSDFNYYRFDRHDIDYGHMVTFKQNNQMWFFRIVGLPGDQLELRRGFLYINGDSCKTVFLNDTSYTEEYSVPSYRSGEMRTFTDTYKGSKYVETLPNGHQHQIFRMQGDTVFNNRTVQFNVPAEHYFVMGDSRNGARDSRYIGPIHRRNITGRMTRIFIGNGRFNIDLLER